MADEETPWGPRIYGLITVEYRRGTDDFHAYLTESDPRIGVVGRGVYEAVGDLVVHHPEHFAAQRPEQAGSSEVERLTAYLRHIQRTVGRTDMAGPSITNEIRRVLREALAQPARSEGDASALDPRAAELLRARSKYPGYNLHAYHGFKHGPQPGCNAGSSVMGLCGLPLDEHCQCGDGDHVEPLPPSDEQPSREA